MRKILISIILCVIVFYVKGQNPSDLYLHGYIGTDENNLEIIMIIENSDTDITTGLFVPSQFTYDLKASKTIIKGDSINIKFSRPAAELLGHFDGANIEGVWKQGRSSTNVSLRSVNKEEIAFLNRPQTPVPPYPYIEKEIIIENKKNGSKISGTLTLPDTTGNYSLAILITGSGSQNRDEEIAGHKPFLIISDYLTRNGIAVFRYDDRGVGRSTGNPAEATTKDFADDVNIILKFMANQSNIDNKKIGLIGHSEGGIIAMICAAENKKNVSYIVSLAGPGVNTKELLLKQSNDINSAAGITGNLLDITNELQRKIMDIPERSKNPVEIRNKVKELYEEAGKDLSEDEKNTLGLNNAGINRAVSELSSPWIQYFFTIEPSKYLKKIKCPVLALNGNKDIQVDADMNLAGIEAGLKSGKNTFFEIYKLDGLNHLFQKAEKGTVDEYFRIQETISPEVLELMVDFIKRINLL